MGLQMGGMSLHCPPSAPQTAWLCSWHEGEGGSSICIPDSAAGEVGGKN